MAEKKIKVSVIIVNYNTPELTKECVDSILGNTKDINFEIIIIDNASKQKVKKSDKYELIHSTTNLGFAGGNNLGIAKSRGEYVLLLNSDTKLKDNVIEHMCDWMDNHVKVGIATCKLIGTDGKTQSPGGSFPSLLKIASWMTIEDLPYVDKLIKPFHPKDASYDKAIEMDWITGTFFLIRRKVIDQIGMLDEDYFMYTEEVDFCYRAGQKGWGMWHIPEWSITHYGKASSNNEFALTNEFKGIKTFYKKHHPEWQLLAVRFFLKLGSLLRIIAFTLVNKNDIAKIYVKTFKIA